MVLGSVFVRMALIGALLPLMGCVGVLPPDRAGSVPDGGTYRASVTQ
jgi:hypothetical protein